MSRVDAVRACTSVKYCGRRGKWARLCIHLSSILQCSIHGTCTQTTDPHVSPSAAEIPLVQLLPDMPLLHTLMKMTVMSARFTRGRQPEPDFFLGLGMLSRCTSHCYYWHVVYVLRVSEWVVTLLAAARENGLPTLVSVGIQSRGTWERCFVVLGPVGLAPGVGRDWMSPAANYSSYQSRSSHPGLACVDMNIDDIGADVDSADPASALWQ